MKFLHTSDVHYGAAPDQGRLWSKERCENIAASLEQIADCCRNENVEVLMICGDLFNAFPTIEQVEAVNEVLSKIPDTHVYIIPGKSDALLAGSPVITYPWAENITYCTEDKMCTVCHGTAKILMAYGEVPSCISDDQYSYVALGGEHHRKVITPDKVIYSGSPQPIEPADTGKHGYYLGEIDESGNVTSLNFVYSGGCRYISLAVNVTPASSESDVETNISNEIERRGVENIYRIRLSGKCDPKTVFSLNNILNKYRVMDITDLTEPYYDYGKLMAEHPADLVGFFINETLREDISDMDKTAMYYGIDALLKTSDERNQ